ncbi:hypothetical protein NDU88_002807 [Pleurodeles waltl]|uniref:Uncharacterized protein n=1 Tax=Pleurodeles waltl TaxID=8319 RepID=A0AAV7KVA7_PLEWA|nr:hypothetical protein NDU88_002807 [Pleurodeles waltl]
MECLADIRTVQTQARAGPQDMAYLTALHCTRQAGVMRLRFPLYVVGLLARQPDPDTMSMDWALSGDRGASGGYWAAETPDVVSMSPGQSRDRESRDKEKQIPEEVQVDERTGGSMVLEGKQEAIGIERWVGEKARVEVEKVKKED